MFTLWLQEALKAREELKAQKKARKLEERRQRKEQQAIFAAKLKAIAVRRREEAQRLLSVLLAGAAEARYTLCFCFGDPCHNYVHNFYAIHVSMTHSKYLCQKLFLVRVILASFPFPGSLFFPCRWGEPGNEAIVYIIIAYHSWPPQVSAGGARETRGTGTKAERGRGAAEKGETGGGGRPQRQTAKECAGVGTEKDRGPASASLEESFLWHATEIGSCYPHQRRGVLATTNMYNECSLPCIIISRGLQVYSTIHPTNHQACANMLVNFETQNSA